MVAPSDDRPQVPGPGGDATAAPRLSAVEFARAMGDALPHASSITAAELALADAARALLDAVAACSADDATRAALARRLEQLRAELVAAGQADPVRLVRHPDGSIENAIQAGTGRLNPRSLRIAYDDAADGSDVRGTVVLGASCVGPPGRAHGGIVATILDEALGRAMTKAGRTGMTVALDVSLKAAMPLHEPLDIVGGVVAVDGRKTIVQAEVRSRDAVVALGRGVFVTSRPSP